MLRQGSDMMRLIAELYPICRSITGDGVRETLRRMQRVVPLETFEVPSGTRVFDWQVPKEWNIRDAYVANLRGERVIDFRRHNLHVMSYSMPVNARMTRDELIGHVHSLPGHPDWIPYRTSYYREAWAFCTRHAELATLDEPEYDVRIDSSLTDGALTYGELFLPGRSADEVLVYSHTCHPSLANDNLSGLAVTAFLAARLRAGPQRRLGVRFVWGPGTIGSITWLATNEAKLPRIKHGLVAVLLGDPGRLQYKQTRFGDARIDRVASHVLSRRNGTTLPFDPYGYDERQFGSPGIALPVGRLTRSPNGTYPEYHSSADNLDLLDPERLQESLEAVHEVLDALDGDVRYVNTSPKGEPQLGRRGLYRPTGGDALPERELAMLWILNRSDGTESLFDIAERAGLPFEAVRNAADELAAAGLLTSAEAQ